MCACDINAESITSYEGFCHNDKTHLRESVTVVRSPSVATTDTTTVSNVLKEPRPQKRDRYYTLRAMALKSVMPCPTSRWRGSCTGPYVQEVVSMR